MGRWAPFARGSGATQGRLSRILFGDDWGIRAIDGRTAVDSAENRARLARFAILPAGAYAALGIVLVLGIAAAGTESEHLDVTLALLALLGVAAFAAPLGWLLVTRAPLPWFHLLGFTAVGGVIAVGYALGPELRAATITAWTLVMISIAVATSLRATVAYTVATGVGAAVLFATQEGPNPVAMWVATMGGLVIVGWAVSWLVERIRELGVDAWSAHEDASEAHAATAELNRTLADRVSSQVAELERLRGLQRFLPGPLVDLVLSGGLEMLEPHGRDIAVMICDLRGSTAWAAASTPDEVNDLMADFFALLGEHATNHRATVGAFTGDGMMAFWNDPVPCEDPVDRAVSMALDLQAPMTRLLLPHQKPGCPLGFGVGITYGYANIGMIGFEGRRDYTALGSVVNLADRLCAKAGAGEVLLDEQACAGLTEGRCGGDPIELELKGFAGPVTAYRLSSPALHA